MKIAIALSIALLLLFGCASVPQSKYDELKTSCELDKKNAADALSFEKSKSTDFKRQASDCAISKQGVETLLSSKNAECESLVNCSKTMAQARIKTTAIASYNKAVKLYSAVYGPGMIPNSANIRTAEEYVLSLNDPPLYTAWLNIRKCQGITDCESAKSKFLGLINSTTTRLSIEIAEIVK